MVPQQLIHSPALFLVRGIFQLGFEGFPTRFEDMIRHEPEDGLHVSQHTCPEQYDTQFPAFQLGVSGTEGPRRRLVFNPHVAEGLLGMLEM